MKRGAPAVAALTLACLLVPAGCGEVSGEGDRTTPTTEILSVPKGNQPPGAETPSAKNAAGPAAGGSSSSTYVSRADAVCGRFQPRIEAWEKRAQVAAGEGDFATAADLFGRGVSESERELAALRGLAAPAADATTLDQIYAGLAQANRLFRSSLDDLRSGDVTGFNSVGDRARLASNRAKRAAAPLGFQLCAKGA
jgi:hypothetical protein